MAEGRGEGTESLAIYTSSLGIFTGFAAPHQQGNKDRLGQFVRFVFYPSHSICSPIRSRPTSKNEIP